MNSLLKILLAAPLLMAGCAPRNQPSAVAVSAAPTARPALIGAQVLQKTCRVCVVQSGQPIEEFLPSRLDKKVKGTTYSFCADKCRQAFDKSPAKYLLKS